MTLDEHVDALVARSLRRQDVTWDSVTAPELRAAILAVVDAIPDDDWAMIRPVEFIETKLSGVHGMAAKADDGTRQVWLDRNLLLSTMDARWVIAHELAHHLMGDAGRLQSNAALRSEYEHARGKHRIEMRANMIAAQWGFPRAQSRRVWTYGR